jgi:uncharacterized protein (DUF3084 family)
MATQNPVFEDVAKSMFMYSSDKDVLEQCYKVEYNQRFVNHLSDENKSLKANNAELKAINADKDNQIADKDNQIAELNAKLAYYESQQNK